MSDTPFIKFYPSDFLAGVGDLSAAERGVYITLLSLIWDRNGPVEHDDRRLARRCGVPKPTFRKILVALIEQGKITVADGRLSNRRAEKALVDRQMRVEKSRRMAASRWNVERKKVEENQGEENAAASAKQCLSDASPESRVQSQNKEGGGGGARAENPADQRPEETTLRERVLIAIGYDPNGGFSGPSAKVIGGRADTAEMERWLALPGITADAIVDEVSQVMRTRSKGDGLPSNFRYFTKAMQRLSAALTAPPLEPAAGRPGQGPQATYLRPRINPDDYDEKGNRIRPR